MPDTADIQTTLAPTRGGDRVTGARFASRSAVWGCNGAAASAHPLATLIGIDILKAGGSAVDAAIAVNIALGLLEPIACGIGGDAFCLLWDPKTRAVVGLNGSGRSPRALTLEEHRRRAEHGQIHSHGVASVSVPGAVDAWWMLHQRYGKLQWADLFAPTIAIAEAGTPVAQTVAYYLASSQRAYASGRLAIEETDNFLKVWAPKGRTPVEGEVFANPALARTLWLIAEGGRDAYYEGEIAETIERYFARIGGWMTKADLAAHRGDWVTPATVNYRGVDVWGLPPNGQGLVTLQMLNMLERFDLAGMGFLATQALHHMIEAKRLAFEDRARYYGDPAFSKLPIEWLISKEYAAERAALIRPDRMLVPAYAGEAPGQGDTTYLCAADGDGMMVSLIQSNFNGMGSGLSPDGLGFMFQNRGRAFSLQDGHPNLYAPGKRPFHTIIPGFATKGGEPWLAFGVMGGNMQPQGQTQIITDLVDFGLGLQEAGDAPRWLHEFSTEPNGLAALPPNVREAHRAKGVLALESGMPQATRDGLAALGHIIADAPGGYGGYQAIERLPGRYAAATEMRKDGAALAC